MQQTPTYKLSQWDPEDRIQRTDFNNDNLKIENALYTIGQKAGLFQYGPGITLKSNAPHLIVDIRHVNWQSCGVVHAVLTLSTKNGTSVSLYLMTKKSEYIKVDTICGTASEGQPLATAHAVFFPMYEPERKITILLLGTDSPGIKTFDMKFSEIAQFTAQTDSDDYAILAGSKARCYAEL